MSNLWAYIKANWKTSLCGFAAFIMSVPADVTAFQQWQAGQTVDWHFAAASTVLALIGLAAKDGNNHSTEAQVQKATSEQTKTEQKP